MDDGRDNRDNRDNRIGPSSLDDLIALQSGGIPKRALIRRPPEAPLLEPFAIRAMVRRETMLQKMMSELPTKSPPTSEEPFLCSRSNCIKSFVRFFNMTEHKVSLFWIDYTGQAIRYAVLSPKKFMDIDTYVTHPWICVDDETKDRCYTNYVDVFFPQPHRNGETGRVQVTITTPTYSLRHLALRAVAAQIKNFQDACKLDIPLRLREEVEARVRNRIQLYET